MFDGRVAIFRRHGAENESREEIAPAQVLLISRRVLRRRFCDAVLLGRAKFETQAFNYSLRNLILHGDDVLSRGIYTIAPEYVARADV